MLTKLFDRCDADKDGFLSPTEWVAAQRLVAELSQDDVVEEECAAALQQAAAAAAPGNAGIAAVESVSREAFPALMGPLLDALNLGHKRLLAGLERQAEPKASAFGRAAQEMAHTLVRNTSNIADPEPAAALAPPPELWRTQTGGHNFELPEGIIDARPEARVAYQTVQFLAGRTEDASFIAPALAAQMVANRELFRTMLDGCGEVAGVHMESSAPIPCDVDLFLMQPAQLEPLFRLRVLGMMCRRVAGAWTLVRLRGFEPSPVEPADVPTLLWAALETRSRGGGGQRAPPDLAALGHAPAPVQLTRSPTIAISNAELQRADLVLTAAPVSRHVFRIKFSLAGRRPPERHYLLLVPRLKTQAEGHCRYADHTIRARLADGGFMDVVPFGGFVVVNVPGSAMGKLTLEHEFVNCRVRVQLRREAQRAHVQEAPDLMPEERAVNLGDDFERAEHLRQVLERRGLGRKDGERDLAYAVRLGRELREGYAYDAQFTERNVTRLSTLIWEERRGDCSAFNAGFVYALRAYGIPARVSLGFKYGHAVKGACGSFVATHAQCEFFAEDIGWVPCDATLGVKRLGHEANSQLTFVEWRPAVQSLFEAGELAEVMTSPKDATSARRKYEALWADVAEHSDPRGRSDLEVPLSARSLAAGMRVAEGLTLDAANLRSAKILSMCDFDADGRIGRDDFVRGMTSVELGARGSDLGMGDPLSGTAQAGAKFFEGGPYLRGTPLEQQKLRENMMVMEDIDQVMDHVGVSQGATDWSQMWPYGVFTCSYAFEERPV